MPIDLRKNAAELREMLVKGVRRYSDAHSYGVSKPFHPPVTRMEFLYSLGDGTSTPWVALNIDTRPDVHEESYTHPFLDMVMLDEWGGPMRYLTDSEKSRMQTVLWDGQLVECNCEQFEGYVRQLFVAVLTAAREQQLFANLPKASRCEIGVIESGTGFDWPNCHECDGCNLV